jgi:hypothetical protein
MNNSCVNILLDVLNQNQINENDVSTCREFLGKFIMMFQIVRNINKDNIKDILDSGILDKEIDKIKNITESFHREQNMYILLLKNMSEKINLFSYITNEINKKYKLNLPKIINPLEIINEKNVLDEIKNLYEYLKDSSCDDVTKLINAGFLKDQVFVVEKISEFINSESFIDENFISDRIDVFNCLIITINSKYNKNIKMIPNPIKKYNYYVKVIRITYFVLISIIFLQFLYYNTKSN